GADPLGMVGGEPLRDPAAHRRAVDGGPADVEIVEDSQHVGGEFRRAVGAIGFVAVAGAAPVDADRGVRVLEVLADAVPPVVVVGLTSQEHERWTTAPHLVGDTGSARGRYMRHEAWYVPPE